ncbi:discoidin domain-containing protein [Streptomyces sp. H27-H1]|uniref:discoidin domain-containing protein n=1 Tax=Streptomyces sp. H27-H1 TaxID=2996461 RepID=UPI00226FBA2C|nr:discoidin domain-containing protein [Streptomyces sp. H27-H1]MCY0925376.1 discoidin domain-containing protein [Streptomyces sp. H27-H1]
MAVTRRTFLATALVGSATGALLGVPAPRLAAAVAVAVDGAASAPGDVVGKITVGYQGWFACAGDGAPINAWWHWSQNWSQAPSPGNNVIKAWPDMRDYTQAYQTGYGRLGSGGPATLFSSYDQQTVDAHFLSMRQNGCDTAALQRFNPNSSEGPTRDAMAVKVRNSAETHGRKFYVMYDVSGWTNMRSEIKADWTSKMSAHTGSPAYARQNGKPVVCIWGFGFNDSNHPWDAAVCLDVVNWFKAQGCYVIGGVPREWRTGGGGSRPGYLSVYHAFHMISPWMVGAISNSADSDSVHQNIGLGDQADCDANGIDYQPCVLPGDLSLRQRVHGDFMWRQFYNMVRLGAQGIYISMFDEYNEGNQIAKTAETAAGVPTGSGLLALDEDGTACSADYYLRLTADGGRMLKGQLALTATRPTAPVVSGPPDGQAPTAPAGLAVTGHTTTSVSLSWTPSADNVQVAGYTINSLAGGASTPLATTTATAFTVTGLAPATVYSLCVTAHDAAGNVSPASGTVTATTDHQSSTVDLARQRPTTESSHTQGYACANAVDDDPNSYWESANNAFPQWLQVDLGAAQPARRIVLAVPPPSAWSTRTQTVSVAGSTDGSTFTTLIGAGGYTFDPSTGNSVTLSLPAGTTTRHLRLTFTANTGWPAGQISALKVYSA